MKCSECPQEIPAIRLRTSPRTKTCSPECAGERRNRIQALASKRTKIRRRIEVLQLRLEQIEIDAR